MRLWSFQPEKVADELLSGHRFICDPRQSSYYDPYEEFRRAYDWIGAQVEERVPRPDGVELPVWAWALNYGLAQRPDRRRMLFRNFARTDVILELEVPDELVILSDFDDWHCVLNDIPIRTDAEWEHDADREFTVDETRRSWQRIFSVEGREFVQACLWTIEPEWLIQAHSLRSR